MIQMVQLIQLQISHFLQLRFRPLSLVNPVLKQMLTALKSILAQASEYATAKSIEPDALLQARLAPDMFPLLKQGILQLLYHIPVFTQPGNVIYLESATSLAL